MLTGPSNTDQGSKDFSFKIHLNPLLSVFITLFLLCLSSLPLRSWTYFFSSLPYLPRFIDWHQCKELSFPGPPWHLVG